VPVPVNTSPSYTDALPSVSLKVGLTDNSNVRLVYGRGLSRPDSYQLVPYATVDDSTNPATTAIGNPALKPEHANNYDVLFEQFLQPVGLIQAGVFYKQLIDPLVTETYTPNTGTYAGQLVTQWINSGNATLYGFELSYQQHLTRLPGFLSGLGVLSNYSWTTSTVSSLPGRTDTPALQRQAPNTWNLSPTYDRARYSLRLGLTYNAPSIYMYQYTTASDVSGQGPKGPTGDQYTYAHLQIDAQGTMNLTRSLRLTVYGLNLSNEVYGLYNGSPQFVRQREYYKTTVAFGLRYIFNGK
jgi:TonB-dependent receptor